MWVCICYNADPDPGSALPSIWIQMRIWIQRGKKFPESKQKFNKYFYNIWLEKTNFQFFPIFFSLGAHFLGKFLGDILSSESGSWRSPIMRIRIHITVLNRFFFRLKDEKNINLYRIAPISVSDPDSVVFWIRIRIRNADPDLGA